LTIERQARLSKEILAIAVLVAIVHVIAMIGAGGCLAWLVYATWT